MRHALLALPILLIAASASAQAPQARAPDARSHSQAPVPPAYVPAPPPPGAPAPVVVPPELTDPRLADQIGRVAGVLTRSMMDLPVGELEAAIEGRPVVPSDRGRRVRDTVADPYLDQRIAAEAAASGRTMQAATRALANSLPAIMQSLEVARAELERATANLPSPAYPRR